MDSSVKSELDRLFQDESRFILATLLRSLGEFDLAEEAMQESFSIAAEKWPQDGIPSNPRSWLISTARFKAIDRLRRDQKTAPGLIEDELRFEEEEFDEIVNEHINDDMLRLIFVCSHPELSIEGQVALTLREVCGLTTEEVAKAFLLPVPTMAQRLSRAKAKLREIGAVLEQPSRDQLNERLPSVLRVIYLVFNEGYYSSSGEELTNAGLSEEAIRLGELLARLMPHPEVSGLNALMCFSESRRSAREHEGEIVLLEDQDRSLWNSDLIDRGNRHLAKSLEFGEPGFYTIHALSSAEHANADSPEETDWQKIVEIYDRLDAIAPSPIVKLNRAVAVAMSGQIDLALNDIEALIESGELKNYGLAHAAQADLLRRLGRTREALESYHLALDLSQMEPERKFLQRRIRELTEN